MGSGPPGVALPRLPAVVLAGLCMAGATLCSSLVNAFLRHLSQEVHPFEVAFLRMFLGLVFLLPILIRTGPAALRTKRHGLFLLRGAITAVMTAGWTYALFLIPIDKATALSFTMPLWITLGAAIFLGEAVGWVRWAAVAAGFAGSLVILRPGLAAYEAALVLPLMVAAASAVVMLIIKVLARTEAAHTVVLYMGLYTTPFLLLFAIPVWVTPGPGFLFWTFVAGSLGSLGHLLYTRAMALADASVAAPFDFLRLPYAAVIGMIWFGELMDGWSWVGAGVIVAAAAFSARREAAAANTRRAASTGSG
ncbi:MAG: DMT family transporter [Proteobacteria bacterium]|nr:DMT family transporter [Pseudomonadota bacterium]